MNIKEYLSIKNEGQTCDYCQESKKCVSKVIPGNSLDICIDCVLEIYEFAKKEVLWLW